MSEYKLTEEEHELLQVLKPNWDDETVFFEILSELKEELNVLEKIDIKVKLEKEYELEKNME